MLNELPVQYVRLCEQIQSICPSILCLLEVSVCTHDLKRKLSISCNVDTCKLLANHVFAKLPTLLSCKLDPIYKAVSNRNRILIIIFMKSVNRYYNAVLYLVFFRRPKTRFYAIIMCRIMLQCRIEDLNVFLIPFKPIDCLRCFMINI